MSYAFETRGVTVQYPRSTQPALLDINIAITRGEFVGLIGPNGSGKSTLLRSLLGAFDSVLGSVLYEGRVLSEWPRREFARHVGAVSQLDDLTFPLTVRELVNMGRYPHVGALGRETARDESAVLQAMERAHVTQLAHRPVTSLSGGERQRARIARALAQEPETLVLDEPTASLDIAHEMSTFELLRSLCRVDGRTVIVATHHLNLAARYVDTLLLLHNGQLVLAGSAAQVLHNAALQQVYDWPLVSYSHMGAGFDAGAPQITPLSQDQQK
jgi:iron complex transport system ATP-binding protein